MKAFLAFLIVFSILSCSERAAPPSYGGPGYPVAALVKRDGDGSGCSTSDQPTTPVDICEWLNGFDAVIGGVVTSVALVSFPHSSMANKVPIDDTACLGPVSPALELKVDVTHVFFGSVSSGSMTILVSGQSVEQMLPHPYIGPAGAVVWDGANEKTPFELGTWLGLPLTMVAGRGHAVVGELPFASGESLELAPHGECSRYPRPANLDGISFVEFSSMAKSCQKKDSSTLDSRLSLVSLYPMGAYAAICYPVANQPDCDVEEDCGSGTTCIDGECVQETSPPNPND